MGEWGLGGGGGGEDDEEDDEEDDDDDDETDGYACNTGYPARAPWLMSWHSTWMLCRILLFESVRSISSLLGVLPSYSVRSHRVLRSASRAF